MKMDCYFAVQVTISVLLMIPAHGIEFDGDLNPLIDTMAADTREGITDYGYDPLNIPGGRERFSKKIVWVRFYGDARYYNGKLYGLSTIHRAGDAHLTNPTGRTLTVDANMGFGRLIASYDTSASFNGLRVGAKVRVTITRSRVHFEASQSVNNNGNPQGNLQLDRFDVTHLGDMDVTVSGLGPLNWIVGQISRAILNDIRPTLRRAISQQVKGLLQQELNKHRLADYIDNIPALFGK